MTVGAGKPIKNEPSMTETKKEQNKISMQLLGILPKIPIQGKLETQKKQRRKVVQGTHRRCAKGDAPT